MGKLLVELKKDWSDEAVVGSVKFRKKSRVHHRFDCECEALERIICRSSAPIDLDHINMYYRHSIGFISIHRILDPERADRIMEACRYGEGEIC